MSVTATALREQQSDNRLRYAMDRLLHRLRAWVSVYPIHEDDNLPEHDVQWCMDASGDGPQKAILAAIKMHPELWAGALPNECCIVRRDMLARYVGKDTTEALAEYGAHAVANQAAHLRHEAEERERRK